MTYAGERRTVQEDSGSAVELGAEQQQAFAGTTSAYEPLTDETGMGLYWAAA